MKVKVEMELDVNEVAVAWEYGLEIADVEEFVKESASNDLYMHYSNLGWLREGRWSA